MNVVTLAEHEKHNSIFLFFKECSPIKSELIFINKIVGKNKWEN